MLPCLIATIEHLHVATVYIPVELMQAYTDDNMVQMKLEGDMVEIFTKMEPKMYQK